MTLTIEPTTRSADWRSPRPADAWRRILALYREVARREPAYIVGCTVILVSVAPVLLAFALDARTIGTGALAEPIWLKPLKFQIALLIYLGSLALFALARPARLGRPRAYAAYGWVVVAAVLAEIAWIAGAAAMGTTSHFNTGTPLGAAIYSAMGVAAVTLTSASLVTAAMIARGGVGGAVMRTGLVWGLALTFLATVIVAGALSSRAGHLVGEAITGARVPLLGWSREVGDLRAAHFLATHAMHVVPAIALVAAWTVRAGPALDPARACNLVRMAAVAYAVLIACAFAQALAGLPVLPA